MTHTPFSDALCEKANRILAACKQHGLRVATVESCTGGLLSAILTELPGSSDMFTHGFVTYANAAKEQMVGVPKKLLDDNGAVSEPVARAMAEGGLSASGADVVIAITGVAGPGGGSDAKPVGTVHLACAVKGGATTHRKMHYTGDRSAIRLSAVDTALDMLMDAVKR